MLGLFLEGILALPLAAGLSWEICFEGGLTELSEELFLWDNIPCMRSDFPTFG